MIHLQFTPYDNLRSVSEFWRAAMFAQVCHTTHSRSSGNLGLEMLVQYYGA